MPHKTKLSQEDLDAFHQAVAGTKPLKTQKRIRKNLVLPRPAVKEAAAADESIHVQESLVLHAVRSDEFIKYHQEGISNKTLRKLRKGQYNVDAVLDLHGLSIEKARMAVEQFLQQCMKDQLHVVLIIHGKGHHSQMPVLKNKLNLWLRSTQIVLAFCSAAPFHGSRGAVYVLLKRTLEEKSV